MSVLLGFWHGRAAQSNKQITDFHNELNIEGDKKTRKDK